MTHTCIMPTSHHVLAATLGDFPQKRPKIRPEQIFCDQRSCYEVAVDRLVNAPARHCGSSVHQFSFVNARLHRKKLPNSTSNSETRCHHETRTKESNKTRKLILFDKTRLHSVSRETPLYKCAGTARPPKVLNSPPRPPTEHALKRKRLGSL